MVCTVLIALLQWSPTEVGIYNELLLGLHSKITDNSSDEKFRENQKLQRASTVEAL